MVERGAREASILPGQGAGHTMNGVRLAVAEASAFCGPFFRR